ncbi:hypothetical protein IMAU80188_03071 [Lactiplantibacillus plantarum]|nr:hypothetical protein [Lactiplantibacillus plantarum]MCG0619421.1 hypothetical protein [Lactiplantibacillus plantarum]MCG0807871.1 hypothetical protein [Lactiplantibacillus plantarum]MCG0832855.1 hypothetical protein [Lactiplantibacillus plantarum]MCG0851608.1 hypothetical protein [Lactiplantibacillus plantarum]
MLQCYSDNRGVVKNDRKETVCSAAQASKDKAYGI